MTMTRSPAGRFFLVSGLLVAVLLAGRVAAQSAPDAERPLPRFHERLLERDDLRHVARLQNSRDTIGLIVHLEDPDAAVRARAALAFGSVRAPVAAPALYPLLEDADPAVRAFAAFGIGQSGQVLAIPHLIDAMHRETDPAALVQVMNALGRVGDRPALAALVSARVPAEVEAERSLAIARFGIRGVHDPGAVRMLVGHLGSGDERLRLHAAYYFGRVTDTEAWAAVADSVIAIAARLGPRDAAQLHLATALGRLGSAAAEEHLVGLLWHGADWRIRVNAARALSGDGRSGAATGALVSALDDPSHHVAVAAATALSAGGELSGGQLDHLERWGASRADEWQVWSGSMPALVSAGRLGIVRELLAGGIPPAARAAVLRALGRDRTETGFELLAAGIEHPDPVVAAGAVEGLRARWTPEADRAETRRYLDLLTTALRRGEGAVVYAAAPALGDSLLLTMGSGEVLREVYDQLRNGRNIGAMDQIIRAQAAARDTAALDFLVGRAIDAPHPVLRQAAVEALTERFGEGFLFRTLGGGPPRFPALDWDYLESLGPAPRLVLETERGTVVLELHTEWAPATVQAITRIAADGLYDGVPFHRVVPNFVIQGGDYDPGDGFGGPDFFLPSELTPLPYTAGTLGMASSGPDTEGSQFFVTHSMQPHLDGNYTVFGRILSGQETVDAIRAGDRVISARVEAGR